jgi:hypothetical protein
MMSREKGWNNLVPLASRPPEEQRAIRRKAQRRQQESMREKKTIKMCLEMLRDMQMPADKCQELGLPEGTTYAMGIATSMVNGTLEKNPAMTKLLLEAMGEVKNEINVNGAMPVVIHDDID